MSASGAWASSGSLWPSLFISATISCSNWARLSPSSTSSPCSRAWSSLLLLLRFSCAWLAPSQQTHREHTPLKGAMCQCSWEPGFSLPNSPQYIQSTYSSMCTFETLKYFLLLLFWIFFISAYIASAYKTTKWVMLNIQRCKVAEKKKADNRLWCPVQTHMRTHNQTHTYTHPNTCRHAYGHTPF